MRSGKLLPSAWLVLSFILSGAMGAQTGPSGSPTEPNAAPKGGEKHSHPLPDSPSAVRSEYDRRAADNSSSQQSGSTPLLLSQTEGQSQPQSQTPTQSGGQTQAQPQTPTATPPQKPVGTAAAEAPNVSAVAASQPAGIAIAPAKQHRVRTIVLKTGAIIGAGVAIGAVVALTAATPSKPPGAH